MGSLVRYMQIFCKIHRSSSAWNFNSTQLLDSNDRIERGEDSRTTVMVRNVAGNNARKEPRFWAEL